MNARQHIDQRQREMAAQLRKMTKRPNPTLLLGVNPSPPSRQNPRGEGRKVPLGSPRKELRRHDLSEFEGDPEFEAAVAMYEKFHGAAPAEVIEVEIPEGAPKFLVALGQAPDVTYKPPKDSPKGKGAPFLHEWTTPPYLATDPEGNWLGYVGFGKGYAIRPEGIVG